VMAINDNNDDGGDNKNKNKEGVIYLSIPL
jgi:hypothetical protein